MDLIQQHMCKSPCKFSKPRRRILHWLRISASESFTHERTWYSFVSKWHWVKYNDYGWNFWHLANNLLTENISKASWNIVKILICSAIVEKEEKGAEYNTATDNVQHMTEIKNIGSDDGNSNFSSKMKRFRICRLWIPSSRPTLIELQPQGLQSHADQQPIERMAMKTFINCLNHHTFCKNINWNTLYYLQPTFFPIQLPGDKGLIKLIPLFDDFLLNILKMQWLIFLKKWHFTIIFGLLSEGWNCIITRHNPYGTFRS